MKLNVCTSFFYFPIISNELLEKYVSTKLFTIHYNTVENHTKYDFQKCNQTNNNVTIMRCHTRLELNVHTYMSV